MKWFVALGWSLCLSSFPLLAQPPALPRGVTAAPASQPSAADAQRAARYVEAVRQYADTVLAHGRDTYGQATPLFVDGLSVLTYEPVTWHYDEHVWTLSNLANQQDLLRTLDGLTTLTGRPQYRQAAVDAVRYAFDHLRTPNGLLLWGGHTAIDAVNQEWVGRRYARTGKDRVAIHELKATYPYYELMWQVDPAATGQYIRSFWAAHVRDWNNLDFDRHGDTRRVQDTGPDMWDRPFDPASGVFFRGKGRTFVNAASDLYVAGGMLYKLDADGGALAWAQRLAGRYVAARDPKTHLRGYQYSTPDETDRAFEQFGDLFPNSLVREATLFRPHEMPAPELALLQLSELLGPDGAQFRQWALEDLTAIGKWAYDERTGQFRTMLLDGTDLSDVSMPRNGYFGRKGRTFSTTGGGAFFLVYATAARLSGNPFMWGMARHTARDAGLGDIGQADGTGIKLDTQTGTADSRAIMGLLQLHRMTARRAYLDLACRVADNILASRFENGLFTGGPELLYTRTSGPAPLAMLHLAATLRGGPDQVPVFRAGHQYWNCEIHSTDKNYAFDQRVIYNQRRPSTASQPVDSQPAQDARQEEASQADEQAD
jgi:pectate lyase